MMPTFFLAGLEAGSLDKLYGMLLENDVDIVVDIRLSREFNLGDRVRELNGLRGGRIGYRWFKVFGNPFFDREDPLESYQGYLMGMDREMEELYELLIRRRGCLVDGEEDPARSYRIMLAEELKKRFKITYADLMILRDLEERYGIKGK